MNQLLGVVATALFAWALAGLVARFRSKGASGLQAAYERACRDLDQTGRTSIRAHFLARLCWVGPIDLDFHGFTVNRLMSTTAYAWSTIPNPLTIKDIGQRGEAIDFCILEKNKRYGRNRFIGNTKREFFRVPHQLPSSYSVGQDRLLGIMNRLRIHSLAAGDESAKRPSFAILYEADW